MYIGKLGDGSSPDDGIYVLVKEIIDNSIDEHMMGHGRTIEIKVTDHRVKVRDMVEGYHLAKWWIVCQRSIPEVKMILEPFKNQSD